MQCNGKTCMYTTVVELQCGGDHVSDVYADVYIVMHAQSFKGTTRNLEHLT